MGKVKETKWSWCKICGKQILVDSNFTIEELEEIFCEDCED